MCITQLEQICFDFNKDHSRLSPLPIMFLLVLSSRPNEWISARELKHLTGYDKEIRTYLFNWFVDKGLVEFKQQMDTQDNSRMPRKCNYYRAVNVRVINPFDKPLLAKIYRRAMTAVLKFPSKGTLILLIYVAIHHRKLYLQTEINNFTLSPHPTTTDKIIRALSEIGELTVIGIGGNETTPRQNTVYDIR